jgi:hypothetical protein
VCHRTCPVHQRTPTSNSSPSGNSRGNSAIIHRTVRCTPDMSGAPRKSGLRNSPASGILFGCSAIIHRNVRCTPDCPVYTGLSGVTAGQRLLLAPTATCVTLNARQRAQRSDTPMLRAGQKTRNPKPEPGIPEPEPEIPETRILFGNFG